MNSTGILQLYFNSPIDPIEFKMKRQKFLSWFKEKHYLLKAFVLLLKELSQLNVYL